MSESEALSRIEIDSLLKQSGWKLGLTDPDRNVDPEYRTPIGIKGKPADYVLMDSKGFPLCTLEAKNITKSPLDGKEQARKYANAINSRFIILSNGIEHYFWDLESGNPTKVTLLPSQGNLESRRDNFKPQEVSSNEETIEEDYIALTQMSDYKNKPAFKDLDLRDKFIEDNNLRFLRYYQLDALKAIQNGIKEGKERFLLEMATGTGKTLTSAAIIKMFIRLYGVKRVLFLVDRLELESQAQKQFTEVLRNDFTTVVWKENEKNWNRAEIVISTVQSFVSNNKYKRIFKEDDFDLVISDEAHRSLGKKSRRVFEHFVGYKLGLTATPKDFLKSVEIENITETDPRGLEKRLMMDTYTTFGCESGEPTFRYSLFNGVKDGYLVNPFVYDGRTEITTELLSQKGYLFQTTDDDGNEIEEVFTKKDFEKRFLSEETNRIFCETFIQNAKRDPYTNEIGKSLVFCVSQKHASKITQIMNEYADVMFPGKYNSDFAVQVTSSIEGSQQMTVDFSNNVLNGNSKSDEYYKTSKTRICVTVGMMTTGYDCTDLLNIAMMRPIYSPSEFIQMKGRGTRKNDFRNSWIDETQINESINSEKEDFALFDFFGNYKYFEEEFDYDQKLKLPSGSPGSGEPPVDIDPEVEVAENFNLDPLESLETITLTEQGMKIDQVYFEKFRKTLQQHPDLKKLLESGEISKAEEYVINRVFDKPDEHFTLRNIEIALKVDRKISIFDILLYGFGLTSRIKNKKELLEEEFEKFDNEIQFDEDYYESIKYFFDAYLSDSETRSIIDQKKYGSLATISSYLFNQITLIPENLRDTILLYINKNIKLEQFS
jgi:type I restriction enzyme R subunit